MWRILDLYIDSVNVGQQLQYVEYRRLKKQSSCLKLPTFEESETAFQRLFDKRS